MKIPALLVCLLISHSSLAVTVYDEAVSGDLSGNMALPTLINTSAGANTILGDIGNNGNTGATDGSDADYFSIIIPTGATLTSISIDSYTFSPGNPGSSFAGYVTNSAFAGQGASNVDAFQLFNAGSGSLFSSELPLGAGTYSFWLQETSSTGVNYQLTFNQTAPIPEPAGAMLLVGGLATMALQRRK